MDLDTGTSVEAQSYHRTTSFLLLIARNCKYFALLFPNFAILQRSKRTVGTEIKRRCRSIVIFNTQEEVGTMI